VGEGEGVCIKHFPSIIKKKKVLNKLNVLEDMFEKYLEFEKLKICL